jgi:hypothetical protein
MSTRSAADANPFDVVFNPAAVLAACEKSDALKGLVSRVFSLADRPNPKLPRDLAEFDAAIEIGKPHHNRHAAVERTLSGRPTSLAEMGVELPADLVTA